MTILGLTGGARFTVFLSYKNSGWFRVVLARFVVFYVLTCAIKIHAAFFESVQHTCLSEKYKEAFNGNKKKFNER